MRHYFIEGLQRNMLIMHKEEDEPLRDEWRRQRYTLLVYSGGSGKRWVAFLSSEI